MSTKNGTNTIVYPKLGCCKGNSPVVQAAFQFSKDIMAKFDGSHDEQHLIRVWGNATVIAGAMESDLNDEDRLVIDLASVLHDVDDHKYRKDGQDHLGSFFKSHEGEISEVVRHRVKYVIDNMGYSTEIKIPIEEYLPILAKEKVLGVIQDADRLDAIGAVGIARCFTFGGSRNRGLYCSKAIEAAKQADYPGTCPERVSDKNGQTTMHFFDKLFHIKNRMKTAKGKELAEKRHATMEVFIRSLNDEVLGNE